MESNRAKFLATLVAMTAPALALFTVLLVTRQALDLRTLALLFLSASIGAVVAWITTYGILKYSADLLARKRQK